MQEQLILRVDHHLVLEVPNVLDQVNHFGIVVKSWSCVLLRELALRGLFRERIVDDFGSGLFWSALELQFGLLYSSLN